MKYSKEIEIAVSNFDIALIKILLGKFEKMIKTLNGE